MCVGTAQPDPLFTRAKNLDLRVNRGAVSTNRKRDGLALGEGKKKKIYEKQLGERGYATR